MAPGLCSLHGAADGKVGVGSCRGLAGTGAQAQETGNPWSRQNKLLSTDIDKENDELGVLPNCSTCVNTPFA